MGTQLPAPKTGAEPPIFGPCLLWPNGLMDQDNTWHGDGPRSRPHCARWRPRSRPKRPKKGAEPPIFGPLLLWPNGWWIKMPLGMEVGLKPTSPCPKGAQPPIFGRCPLWPNAVFVLKLDCEIPRGFGEIKVSTFGIGYFNGRSCEFRNGTGSAGHFRLAIFL